MRIGEVVADGGVVLQLGQTLVRLSPGEREQPVPASAARAFGPLVGRSLPMRELYAQLERVAASDCSVLIEGETGVGKERVAEAIHGASAHAAGPFVVVDCGALSPALMESELFGHVRGAFTGAVDDRVGLVTLADGGTLFLDEIGELPLPLQTKLLGVLERRRVVPVGATRAHPVRIRVIAATHRDLLRRANEGLFRSELYYRLAVVRLRVPPLRDRLDDLPLLVEACLARLRARDGAATCPSSSRRWRWRTCTRSRGRATCASCSTPSSRRPCSCRRHRRGPSMRRGTRMWRRARGPWPSSTAPTSRRWCGAART